MKRTLFQGLCALLLLMNTAGAGWAQEVEIKLGSLVPVGSPWHVLLKEAAEKWKAASSGRVKMKIYAGGVMGNEGDMVKKMRIGQLQAAALSTVGLHEIAEEPMAMDLPFMIQSPEEKEYVLSKMGKRFEEAVEKKGYVVLNWSEIGFCRFFTTKERPSVDEMKQSKIFAWEGDPGTTEAWRKAGFHPVVLSATDIISSFQTGMIDAIVYPPTVVLSGRIHDKAKFMLDMTLASLTGVLVVDKKAWDRIQPADREPLLKIARELGARTMADSRRMEADALSKMKTQGLQVVTPKNVEAWQTAWKAAYPAIRGPVVPAAAFDEVLRLGQEFRAQRQKK